MADDSELDYIAYFLRLIHTTHTVETIETTRNINTMADDQCILVWLGEVLDLSGNIITKQHNLQYRDASEGALNASYNALAEGIRKLNNREAITSYTKTTALVGMKLISSGLDFFHIPGGRWYANIKIIVKWLTV